MDQKDFEDLFKKAEPFINHYLTRIINEFAGHMTQMNRNITNLGEILPAKIKLEAPNLKYEPKIDLKINFLEDVLKEIKKTNSLLNIINEQVNENIIIFNQLPAVKEIRQNIEKEKIALEEELSKAPFGIKIKEAELSVRARNCLANEGIEYVRDLICKTKRDIRISPNVGNRTLKEIEDFLLGLGLNFKQ